MNPPCWKQKQNPASLGAVQSKLSKPKHGNRDRDSMTSRCSRIWRRIWRGEESHPKGIDLPAYTQSTSQGKGVGVQARDLWNPPPYTPEPAAPPCKTTVYASSEDSPYAFLREFDTIFVVDDSSSMLGRRWKEAEEAIAAIAPICTMFDRDGIDIYFLNHRSEPAADDDTLGGYTDVTTAADVEQIFNSVRPRGTTPFGRRLKQILAPYLVQVEKMAARDGWLPDRSLFVKPLNIIAITDGAFTDDAESVVLDAARRLDGCRADPWQVGVQFFQIGTDEVAACYLRELDDDLARRARENGLRDMVDTVPWREGGQPLNAQGIMKCVLGAVHKKYDNQVAFR
jgi:hypothetical protein